MHLFTLISIIFTHVMSFAYYTCLSNVYLIYIVPYVELVSIKLFFLTTRVFQVVFNMSHMFYFDHSWH